MVDNGYDNATFAISYNAANIGAELTVTVTTEHEMLPGESYAIFYYNSSMPTDPNLGLPFNIFFPPNIPKTFELSGEYIILIAFLSQTNYYFVLTNGTDQNGDPINLTLSPKGPFDGLDMETKGPFGFTAGTSGGGGGGGSLAITTKKLKDAKGKCGKAKNGIMEATITNYTLPVTIYWNVNGITDTTNITEITTNTESFIVSTFNKYPKGTYTVAVTDANTATKVFASDVKIGAKLC
jgi:hypothetical protein